MLLTLKILFPSGKHGRSGQQPDDGTEKIACGKEGGMTEREWMKEGLDLKLPVLLYRRKIWISLAGARREWASGRGAVYDFACPVCSGRGI